ncbi:MAG: UvrD-helicase domain-containing protein [Candidatus Thermoplasmatota archaeon]|nr:UvrD-helicase domain-containing protein [Candidatus Thermoplasmatota archaeon]
MIKHFDRKINELIQQIQTYEESLKNDLRTLIEAFNKVIRFDTYLIYHDKQNLIHKCIKYSLSLQELQKNERIYVLLGKTIDDCLYETNGLKASIEKYNPYFVEKRKQDYQWLFNKIPYPLDDDQKTAVITDDTHNLVVAGAGAGKTEVLTTRIAYLVSRKPDTIKQNRILALAFQRKAAEDMRKRIKKRFNIDVEIRTFHSLGYHILKEITGKAPMVYGGDNHDKAVDDLIQTLFEKQMETRDFRNAVINYMSVIGNEEKIREEAEFATKAAFYNHLLNLRLKTLNETMVKSRGEQDIMNFFISHKLNGKNIKIVYEDPQEWMSYTDKKSIEHQPRPDFYLPDYDIYIEHWGIDRYGKPPEYFPGDYIADMEKKKQKFKEHNKTLIETTAGEHADSGNFMELLQNRTLDALNHKYSDQEFDITPIPYQQLVEKVWDTCKAHAKKLPQNMK